MEPPGSMPHSQGLSSNSCPEPIYLIPRVDTYLRCIKILRFSHLRLGLSEGLSPVGLAIAILKELLHCSIPAT